MRTNASFGGGSPRLVVSSWLRRAVIVCLMATGLLAWAAPCRAQAKKAEPAERDCADKNPPTPEELFRVESEAGFKARLRKKAGRDLEFPLPCAVNQAYEVRAFPHQTEFTVPEYTCYGRLYFEQLNMERYGWDLGALSLLLSPAIFYADVATLPYHLATDPCRKCECSAGYCLPGDPVPLLLYLPEFSATGVAAEAATVAVLLAIFP